MVKFGYLHFVKDHSGAQAKMFFENGYGVSVVYGNGRYGDGVNTFELAVLIGDENNWSLTYDTPVTGDVEGHCSKEEIEQLINAIEALPKR